MLRTLYILLLRLHPAAFRERFGDEMLEIAGQTIGFRARVLLIGDGLASLLRQWILRPEFHQPVIATSAPGPTDVPLFRTIEPYKPHRVALLNGTLFTIAIFGAIGPVLGHGGGVHFLIGVHHPNPHSLPIDRDSVAEGELDTTVKFGEKEDPWALMESLSASLYFQLIRVLDALDANHDHTISPREIAMAPAALRRLDSGHDGKLDAEECGFSLGSAGVPPDLLKRARANFMRENPVLAALDSNHDGEISAAEIVASSSTLRALDRNHDGSLAANELMPDQTATQAAMIVMKFDVNDDGTVSAAERAAKEAESFRALLESADRDYDCLVTRQELIGEIRLRAERKRELDNASRAVGSR